MFKLCKIYNSVDCPTRDYQEHHYLPLLAKFACFEIRNDLFLTAKETQNVLRYTGWFLTGPP